MTASFLYECTSQSGALLALQDNADREFVLNNKDWIDYMCKNHASWHRFAARSRRLCIEREKIVLVRGRVRADRWFLTSFVSRGEALHFDFSGEIPYCGGGGVACGYSDQKIHSPASRRSSIFETHQRAINHSSSNTDEVSPRDCLFVSVATSTVVICFVSSMTGKMQKLTRK